MNINDASCGGRRRRDERAERTTQAFVGDLLPKILRSALALHFLLESNSELQDSDVDAPLVFGFFFISTLRLSILWLSGSSRGVVFLCIHSQLRIGAYGRRRRQSDESSQFVLTFSSDGLHSMLRREAWLQG